MIRPLIKVIRLAITRGVTGSSLFRNIFFIEAMPAPICGVANSLAYLTGGTITPRTITPT
jgi:hypothetical protein